MRDLSTIEWDDDGSALDGLIVHGIDQSKSMAEAASALLDNLGDDSIQDNEQREMIRSLIHEAIWRMEATADQLDTFHCILGNRDWENVTPEEFAELGAV